MTHHNKSRGWVRARRLVGWWALRDLNPEPTDYESAALTIELRAQTVYLLNFTAISPNRIFVTYAQFYAHPNPRR